MDRMGLYLLGYGYVDLGYNGVTTMSLKGRDFGEMAKRYGTREERRLAHNKKKRHEERMKDPNYRLLQEALMMRHDRRGPSR